MEFGLVPEYEERETAQETGYKWEEWLAMDTSERADHVAHQRLRHLLSLHTQEASETESERRAKRVKNRGT